MYFFRQCSKVSPVGAIYERENLNDLYSKLIKKMKKIYSIDKNKSIRKSHENPNIIKIYNEYLGEPGSHKAEELLHTKYFKYFHYFF